MPLMTDLITPVELTGYARESLDDYERSLGSLAPWLPNSFIPDIVVRVEVGRAGMKPVMAQYRSWDAETPLGQSQGTRLMHLELPPLGLKTRVSEYEQIRMRAPGASARLRAKVQETVETIVQSMADRVEIERGRAIEFASVDIDENGFLQRASWERDPANTVVSPVLWSDAENATPLQDLITWAKAYRNINKRPVGAIVASDVVLSALQRSKEFREAATSSLHTPSMIPANDVDLVLRNNRLPTITVYDRVLLHRDGIERPVLSPNKVYLLPAPGPTQLGATQWGQTLESDQAEYAIAEEERPGIVAGVWREHDPIGLWVHSAAIALPVLFNPELSFTATVLPA